MDLYYRNETLFVEITQDLTMDAMGIMKRRIFQILDDYGIDKIVITIGGSYDRGLLNSFKKEYYHKYKGYLLIR